MHTHPIGARAHKARSVWVLIAGLGIATGGLIGVGLALAQSSLPASASGDAPSEAMRRQALSPYRFILQNANAPARGKSAAAPEPKRPAPVEQAAARPRVVSPSAAPAAAPQPEPAALPAPDPVAALAPLPVEPPPVAAVRREIIPIKTGDPHLTAALLRERPSGVVKVSFEVRPDGSTGAVKVVSSTNRSLNRASVEAVAGWKFQPVDEVLSVETELAYKFD